MARENGENCNFTCGCSPLYDPPVEKLNVDSCFSLTEPMDDEHEAFSSVALLLVDCYLHT